MATTEQVGKRRPKPKRKQSESSPKKDSGSGYLGRSALKGIIYGPPGIGKSSFCAQFPKPAFIVDAHERGKIQKLVEFGLIPKPEFIESAETFEQARELVRESLDRGIQTLIMDSLTGFEKLCFQEHCDEAYDGNWTEKGFYAFQQGPKSAAKTIWPGFLDILEEVSQAEINLWVIGHAQIKTFNNPTGPDYDRWTPYLDKETWHQTHRWAEMVLAYAYEVDVVKDKGSSKAKADQETERSVIYTTRTPVWDAKNIYGLSPVIEAGDSAEEAYENFEKAFRKAANRGK